MHAGVHVMRRLGREGAAPVPGALPAGGSVLVEFKLNLLAAAALLVAEDVVKSGRTLASTRGEVHAERGGERWSR